MTNPKTQSSKEKQARNELHIAGEIHTLANIVYGELASTWPWAASFSSPSVFSEPRGWPPMAPTSPTSIGGSCATAAGFHGPTPWTH